jgi:hypothetical protein
MGEQACVMEYRPARLGSCSPHLPLEQHAELAASASVTDVTG